jgi:hypothetical protein
MSNTKSLERVAAGSGSYGDQKFSQGTTITDVPSGVADELVATGDWKEVQTSAQPDPATPASSDAAAPDSSDSDSPTPRRARGTK